MLKWQVPKANAGCGTNSNGYKMNFILILVHINSLFLSLLMPGIFMAYNSELSFPGNKETVLTSFFEGCLDSIRSEAIKQWGDCGIPR